jgi:signal transduction histidine kinase
MEAGALSDRGIMLESVYFDIKNRPWLATSAGVYRKDGANFTKILSGELLQSGITALAGDDADNIWVGTTHGAFRIDTLGRASHIDAGMGLTDHTITHIMMDRENNLWFATDADGIYRLAASPIERYDSSVGLNGNVVMGMAKDSRGRIWIGTTDGGLSKLENGAFQSVLLPSTRSESKRVNALYSDQSSTIWVGTLGSGLWRMDHNRFNPVLTDQGNELNEVFAISEDFEGTLWVTATSGLYYFEGNLLHPVSGIEGPGFSIFGFARDTLMVGTTSGLYRVIGKSLVTRIQPENIELHTVNCITRSGKYLVLGTEDDGIIFWDPRTATGKQCSGSDGLPSDFIYSLYPESDASLLAGTGKGVSRVRFQELEQRFRVSNLPSGGNRFGPECNLNSVLPVGTTQTWFGTTKGIYIYPSGSWKNDDTPPLVYLQSVEVLPEGKAKDGLTDTLSTWYAVPRSLRLPPTQNHVTFNFGGVFLSNPESLRYRYRLVGVDTGFSDPVDVTRIIYPNLNPGSYRFRAVAITDNQVASANEIDFPFVIESPVYQKNWFRIVLVAVLLLLGVAIEFFRSRMKHRRLRLNRQIRLDEQQQILERTSEDLHDDLGNKITRITVLTEVLQRKIGGTDTEKSKLVRQIRENAESLYLSTRDILWTLTPGQDTLFDILEKCRGMGAQLFADTEVDFRVEGITQDMKAIQVPLSIARNLNMIVKEAFTNILKHARADRAILSAGFTGNRTLLLVIGDNGVGYIQDGEYSGNGLKNMRKRIDRVGGTINFTNGKDGGFRVSLQIKIPHNEG